MPTAAKLFAAFGMVCTAAAALWLLRADEPAWRETIIAFGVALPVAAVAGWRECGARAGKGAVTSVLAAIRSAIYMVIGSALVLAVIQMFKLAWRRHYEAPTEAVVDIIALAIGFARPLAQAPIVATLLAGAILTGLLAEWAGRRWR